jgi:hypothetical protein
MEFLPWSVPALSATEILPCQGSGTSTTECLLCLESLVWGTEFHKNTE